jgi:hypothetical protein
MSDLDHYLFRCYEVLQQPQAPTQESDEELCTCSKLYQEQFSH